MRKTKPPTRTQTRVENRADWDLKALIVEKIIQNGGWVNCHSHLDRAFTITADSLSQGNSHLHEKWRLVDELKRKSTVDQIYDRMAVAVEKQLAQGVSVIGSFIDVDEVIGDKSMQAAEKIRTTFQSREISVKFINQTLKGVLSPSARKWFEEGAAFADIVGGLPGADPWYEEEHLDVLLETARKLGKLVHVHLDQLNVAREKETALCAEKTIQYGMQDRVVAIHSISLAAQPYEYRRHVYKQMRQAQMKVIACPTAWIDSRRSEEWSPTHNSIVPVEELMAAGFSVGIGTDNIADVYKPFTDGDMWTELRFLLESCHYYDIDNLVKIATSNGRKILGINKE
jgi:cytosine/creatinine deaminase